MTLADGPALAPPTMLLFVEQRERTAGGEILVWAEGLTEGQRPHRLQITEEVTLPCRPGPAVICCGLCFHN